jgi:hypothetical protein
MTIAATRMYRGLDDFLSSEMYDDPSYSFRCAHRAKKAFVALTHPLKMVGEESRSPGAPRPCQFRSM